MNSQRLSRFCLLPLFTVLFLATADLSTAQNFGTPNGGAPPLAYINSPSNGATVSAGRPLTIRAGANSFNGVNSVTFYINGNPVATDHSPPYNYTFTPRVGTYTIHIKARGYFGNWKNSPNVTFRAR